MVYFTAGKRQTCLMSQVSILTCPCSQGTMSHRGQCGSHFLSGHVPLLLGPALSQSLTGTGAPNMAFFPFPQKQHVWLEPLLPGVPGLRPVCKFPAESPLHCLQLPSLLLSPST